MSEVKQNTYTYDEVFKGCLEYFNGDELAATVCSTKYLLKNKNGEYVEKTPTDMFHRIAKEFHRIEQKYPNPLSYEEIFNALDHFKYVVPQGSPLYGIGNDSKLVSIGNCFVVHLPNDSYGSILRTDQEIVQIGKRRGGCLAEGTPVLTENGLVNIENVKIGSKVLSFNVDTKTNEWKEVVDAWETEVAIDDQHLITFENGTELPTSKKHPVLTCNNDLEHKFLSAGEITDEMCGVKSIGNNFDLYNYDKKLNDYGWFLGAHTGDGTFAKNGDLYRIRLCKPNFDIVKKYSDCVNKLVGSNIEPKVVGGKRGKIYKIKMYHMCQRSNDTEKLLKHFDNSCGQKVYTCKVFTQVEQLNLWIPYVAGLMDTDGWVSDTGNMTITICSKDVLYKLATVLSAAGIKTHVNSYVPKRQNEKIIYRMKISYDENFYKSVIELMVDKNKSSKLTSKKSFGSAVNVSDRFIDGINRNWDRTKYMTRFSTEEQKLKRNNLKATLLYVNKKKIVGENAIKNFLNNKFITQEEYSTVSSMIKVKSSEVDSTNKKRYFEISVLDNNNYYAGNGGLVNIHNCGTDVSNIRPRGLSVNNAAQTTDGIAAFMQRYSNTTHEVAQAGGRRGALMLTILCTHMQILDFIKIKRDKTKVTGANISVKFTDEFFDCLKNDKKFVLRHPATATIENAELTQEIDPKIIWDEFITSNWQSAEPGALFWDNIINDSISDCYADDGFKSVSTNPCQPAWAKILTKDGIKTIGDLKIGDEIWAKEGWTKVTNKWSTGIKEVYRYKTSASVFYGTKNHRIVSNGEKIEAHDAESIDLLRGIYESDVIIDKHDVMDGLVLGDGTNDKKINKVNLYIGIDDQDYFSSEISTLIGKQFDNKEYYVETKITCDEVPYTYNRRVPARYMKSRSKICGFLRGLYSANGSVVCNGERITLKSTSSGLIEDVQLMLNSIGIASYVTTNKPSSVKFKNGEYLCKESYDLNITADKLKFISLIGFIQNYKNEKINKNKADRHPKKTYDIREVSLISEEEVFDITVDNESHTYWTQGCDVSNCSELVLSEGASCILMLLNLNSFVNNSYKNDANFDFEKLEKYVNIATRLMDDMIDLESEKIKQIIEKIKHDPESIEEKKVELELWEMVLDRLIVGRRVGLGYTAIADMLASLNVKYGTKEAYNISEKVLKFFHDKNFLYNSVLAKERGKFECWSWEKEKNNNHIKMLPVDIQQHIEKFGRRNISLQTVAPAGSISICTQTSSGIEPVFKAVYSRRKKISPDEEKNGLKPDMVDSDGNKWTTFDVYHHGLKRFIEATGKKFEESPYFGCESHDLSWQGRVNYQAMIQRFVTHSISSTCNVPSTITKEEVSGIYLKAHESGCKGITIYRDGCRDGVLITKDSKKSDDSAPVENNAEKRPKQLKCDIYHSNVLSKTTGKAEKWIFFVGINKDKPYEIFGGKKETIEVAKKYTTGWIVKNGKNDDGFSTYDLYLGTLEESDERVIIKDIASQFKPEEVHVTLGASLCLRHNIPIHYYVKTMNKDKNSSMFAIEKTVARVLKNYIKDGVKVSSSETCPQCKSPLVYRDGCVSCSRENDVNCAWSKCS